LGILSAIAEGGHEASTIGQPEKKEALNNADIDVLAEKILSVNGMRDRSHVAKLTVYLPVSMFVDSNETTLRYFYSKIQLLQQQGVLRWASQRQIYDAYEARNPSSLARIT
jgi:hypothetical protein